MTAGAATLGSVRGGETRLWRRIVGSPHQGWTSLLLVGVMLVVVGVAIDDSAWAGYEASGQSQTAFLPLVLVVAGLLGFLLGRTRLPTLWAHVLAVFVGVAFLLVAVSASISDASTLVGRLRDLSESVAVFYNDVFVLGARSTETSAFLLLISALCWTTGYFAAFNVFRRSRGMPAVVACGVMLLVNMSITARVQYPYLIVLSIAAMLLLVRLNLALQQQGWRRRHIGDGGDVSSLFLRGGVIFVAVTLVGAVVLAASASSAPLANVWRNMDDQLVSLTLAVNRFVGGVTGSTKQAGGLFGQAETIRGVWQSTAQPVFFAQSSDNQPRYWRGAIYDDFDGLTWSQSDRQSADVAAGAGLLADSPDQVTDASSGYSKVNVKVTSISLGGQTMLAPATPLSVDRSAQVHTIGQPGPLVSIDFSDPIDPGQSYTVTAMVPDNGGDPAGVTGNELAAAGVNYPAWARQYVAIRPNSVGTLAYQTAGQIVSRLPADKRDPYHVAVAIQSFFDSTGGFQYRTDVRGLCGRESIVDCLLRTKVGYCQHYATSMVMLLRVEQIPARYVEGYLPGKLLTDGSYEVDESAAHAWVEVYFPRYGWIRFDPTPGNTENGRVATIIPAGVPVATPTPGPSATAQPPTFTGPDIPPGDINHQPGDGPGAQPLPAEPPANPGLIGPAAVTGLMVGAVLLALIARRRRRRPLAEGDAAYRRLTSFAARLGYAPRPSQTAYEYAGTLGDVLPGIRQELHVVAHAKVESTYARRPPQGAALEVVRAAYRKVRVGLLRLFLRRPWRRSRP